MDLVFVILRLKHPLRCTELASINRKTDPFLFKEPHLYNRPIGTNFKERKIYHEKISAALICHLHFVSDHHKCAKIYGLRH